MPVAVSPSIDVTTTPIGATWLRSMTGSWKRITRPTGWSRLSGTLFLAGTKSGSPSSANIHPWSVPRGSLKKSLSVAKRA